MASNQAAIYRSLPMNELISAPLIAAGQAQGSLANITVGFIKQVGFKEALLGEDPELQYVSFKYNSTNTEIDASGNEVVTPIERVITVPLLVIVNVPNLRVTETTVDFKMNITTSQSTDFSANISGSYGFWMWKVKFNASLRTHSSTETESSYKVNVKCRDDGPPRGLDKMLQILENVIDDSNSA